MKNSNTLLVIIAIFLVLSTVGTGVLLFKDNGTSSTALSSQPSEATKNTISVSANGKSTVNPDVGFIQMGVETKDKDPKVAQQKNAELMDAVIKAVKKLGLKDDDIKTTGYNIYPRYDRDDDKPTAYQVSNMVKLRVKDLEKLGDVIDAATQAGANQAHNIYFDVLDRESAYADALKNAVEAARGRADILAEAAGMKVVGVVTINESGSYSPYYDGGMYRSFAKAEMAEDMAGTAIQPGEMDINANVQVVFEISK